jgi:hypothetical protein
MYYSKQLESSFGLNEFCYTTKDFAHKWRMIVMNKETFYLFRMVLNIKTWI